VGHLDLHSFPTRRSSDLDSVLMMIDGAKGVEDRTIKLMEVCRLRDTPILSFINKMDRESREAVELLDEIESVLKITSAPINWPLGSGKNFVGVYNFYTDVIHVYQQGQGHTTPEDIQIKGLDSDEATRLLGSYAGEIREEIEFVRGATHQFDINEYLAGRMTPVFFGTALGNFGVREMLDGFVEWAPAPRSRAAKERVVEAGEDKFSGFIFKIQANMDPKHRDRIAFMRVCSGVYRQGMKMRH